MLKSLSQFFSKNLHHSFLKPSTPVTLSSIGIAAIATFTLPFGLTSNHFSSISFDTTVSAQTAKTTVVRIGHQKFDPLTLVRAC